MQHTVLQIYVHIVHVAYLVYWCAYGAALILMCLQCGRPLYPGPSVSENMNMTSEDVIA